MSNFDNFDIVQISSKLAQRYHFVCKFNCKNFSILGSLDLLKLLSHQLFMNHPISTKSKRVPDISGQVMNETDLEETTIMIFQSLSQVHYEIRINSSIQQSNHG